MKRKKKQKHSIILRLLVLGVAAYMVFTSVGLYRTYRKDEAERDALEAKYAALKADVEDRRELLKNGSQKDIIEKAARERLGYVYSNEEIYTDISGD